MERDSRHKYIPQKELRRYDPRSKFPQKSPFRPHFGAFYPHSAHKSALRAEGPPTHWNPGNLVGPQRPPGHCSAAPRPTTPGPAGSGRAQTFPRWLLPSTDRRIDNDRTGPDLDERSVHIQYVTEFQYVTKPGNFLGQINPFLPACRRPTLDHSLVAGDGQRQWLQACLPDGHQPQRPSLSRGDTAEPRALAALAESERDDWRAPVRRSTGRDRRSEPCAPISFADVPTLPGNEVRGELVGS